MTLFAMVAILAVAAVMFAWGLFGALWAFIVVAAASAIGIVLWLVRLVVVACLAGYFAGTTGRFAGSLKRAFDEECQPRPRPGAGKRKGPGA
jgi:hypothetical protein